VFKVDVYRGLSLNGSIPVGPSNITATVNYYLIPSSATLGVDFSGTNGTVTFGAAATVMQLSVGILIPTASAKSFTVVLSTVSGDVFLAEPSSAIVEINASYGVIGWQYQQSVTVVDSGMPGRVQLSRLNGVYGVVTSSWSLVLNDSRVVFNVVGLNATSGTVSMGDGVSSAAVTLYATPTGGDMSTSRPVQVCRLLLDSATRAGLVNDKYLSLMPALLIVVADSGAAYGVVGFDSNNCDLVVVSDFNN